MAGQVLTIAQNLPVAGPAQNEPGGTNVSRIFVILSEDYEQSVR